MSKIITEPFTIFMHICDGVGQIIESTSSSNITPNITTTNPYPSNKSSSQPPSLSLSTSQNISSSSRLLTSIKKVHVTLSIWSLSLSLSQSASDGSMLAEAVTCASKSSRHLLFDDKVHIEVPKVDINSHEVRISLVSSSPGVYDGNTSLNKVAEYRCSLAGFLKEFKTLKVRRMDHIFELTPYPKLSSTESLSRPTIRLRVAMLIVPINNKDMSIETMKVDFMKLSTNTTISSRKSSTLLKTTSVNTLDMIPPIPISKSISKGGLNDNVSVAKRNQSALIKSLQGMFNAIRKATNSVEQVHMPSSGFIEFVRLISVDAADDISRLVDAISTHTLTYRPNITDEILDDKSIASILQHVLTSETAITNSSRGGRIGSEDKVLLLTRVMIRKYLTIKGVIVKVSFFEECVKSLIFKLLGRQHEILTNSASDWLTKVQDMEKMLLRMQEDFQSMGVTMNTVPTTTLRDSTEKMVTFPPRRHRDDDITTPSNESKGDIIKSDAMISLTDAKLKFQQLQLQVDSQLSALSSTPNKQTSVYSSADVAKSLAQLSQSLSQTRDLQERIRQSSDVIFAATKAVGRSSEAAIGRYQQYIVISHSLRQLERRLVAAVNRLQVQLETMTHMTSSVSGSLLDVTTNIPSPATSPRSLVTSSTKKITSFNSPKRKQLINQVIDSLTMSVSRLLSHVSSQRFHVNMHRFILKVMTSLDTNTSVSIKRTVSTITDVVATIASSLTTSWMDNVTAAMDTSISQMSVQGSVEVVTCVVDDMCREVITRAKVPNCEPVLDMFPILRARLLDRQLRNDSMILYNSHNVNNVNNVNNKNNDSTTTSNDVNNRMMSSIFSERDLIYLYGLVTSAESSTRSNKSMNKLDLVEVLSSATQQGFDSLHILAAAYIIKSVSISESVHLSSQLSAHIDLNDANTNTNTNTNIDATSIKLCSANDFIAWYAEVFSVHSKVSSTLFQGSDVIVDPQILNKDTSKNKHTSIQLNREIAQIYMNSCLNKGKENYTDDVISKSDNSTSLTINKSTKPAVSTTTNTYTTSSSTVKKSQENKINTSNIDTNSITKLPQQQQQQQDPPTTISIQPAVVADVSGTLSSNPNATTISNNMTTSASSSQLTTPIELKWLPALAVHDKVMALFGDGGDWYDATITHIQMPLQSSSQSSEDDNSPIYHLLYDDGDVGEASRLMIKRSHDKQPRILLPRQRILAKYVDTNVNKTTNTTSTGNASGHVSYQPGMVLVVNRGSGAGGGQNTTSDVGTDKVEYVVRFDSHKVDHILMREDIIGPHLDKDTLLDIQTRQTQSNSTSTSKNVVDVTSKTIKPLKQGDVVEGRFGASTSWYPAVVTSVKDGATSTAIRYDLRYDDGDVETSVSRIKIRRRGEKTRSEVSVGDDVDAPCALLAYLNIAPRGDNIIPGKVIEVVVETRMVTVEFDLDSLELRDDVEAKLVDMNEDAVAKISDSCDVAEEGGRLKVRERIAKQDIFSLHLSE